MGSWRTPPLLVLQHLHVFLHELASFDDSEPASTVRYRGTAVGHHYIVMDDISGRPLVVQIGAGPTVRGRVDRS